MLSVETPRDKLLHRFTCKGSRAGVQEKLSTEGLKSASWQPLEWDLAASRLAKETHSINLGSTG